MMEGREDEGIERKSGMGGRGSGERGGKGSHLLASLAKARSPTLLIKCVKHASTSAPITDGFMARRPKR